MLLQHIDSAQANHRAPAKPEGDHRPISLMQIYQELMQTSTVHNIWKIAISEKRAALNKIIKFTWKNQKNNCVKRWNQRYKKFNYCKPKTQLYLTSCFLKIYLDIDLSDIFRVHNTSNKIRNIWFRNWKKNLQHLILRQQWTSSETDGKHQTSYGNFSSFYLSPVFLLSTFSN